MSQINKQRSYILLSIKNQDAQHSESDNEQTIYVLYIMLTTLIMSNILFISFLGKHIYVYQIIKLNKSYAKRIFIFIYKNAYAYNTTKNIL